MRTTLDISDDVLFAARALARRQRQTLGQAVSALARQALADLAAAPPDNPLQAAQASPLAALGITPLPRRGGLVTDELVNHLREQEGI